MPVTIGEKSENKTIFDNVFKADQPLTMLFFVENDYKKHN